MKAAAPARSRAPARNPAANASPAIAQASAALPALVRGACACGGGCPRCSAKKAPSVDVSTPDDASEREAERTAERVMSGGGARRVDRSAANSRPAQTASGAALHVPAAVEPALRSRSEPLPDGTLTDMEDRFARDFSHVRIHRDGEAAQSARAIDARAYTVGAHIVFDAAHYAPESTAGRRLIAHELAHVVQHADAPGGAHPIQRYTVEKSCGDTFKKERIVPGDALAKRWMPHALNSLCGAYYGNDNKRNRAAKGQLIAIFGAEWKTKAPPIYDNLWKLRSALNNDNYVYKCMTGCDREGESNATGTKWGESPVRRDPFLGGPGGTISLCHENLEPVPLERTAHTMVHEMGHLMLGLGHGDKGLHGECNQDPTNAECYPQLGRYFTQYVTPEYTTRIGDLCLAGGSERTRRPGNWDEPPPE